RQMAASVAHLRDHAHVAEIRQRGMILAIELAQDRATRAPYPWQERRGLRIYRHALERGVLLRPVGTTLYFMPPYVIAPEEIELLARGAREGIGLPCAGRPSACRGRWRQTARSRCHRRPANTSRACCASSPARHSR